MAIANSSPQTLKTTINLYTADLKPVVQRFTLKLALQITGAWLVVLILIGWLVTTTAQQDIAAVTELRRSVAQQKASVQTLTTELNQRLDDQGLRDRVTGLQADVAARQRLYDALSQDGDGASLNFAQLLDDLATIADESLWLTDIRIRQGKLGLYGQASRAAAIPEWMARFSETETLSNRQFRVFEINHDGEENSPVQFTLSSEFSSTDTAATSEGRRP